MRVSFDGVHAVDGVDLTLPRGAIMGLIGTNGAGKTTLVNVISGYQRPDAGRVVLGRQEITFWQPGRLARHGIVRTFQSGRVFSSLTVRENVEAAAAGVGLSRRVARARAQTLLEHSGLLRHADSPAVSLATGEIRLAGIVRALAVEPQFMLADEPAAGTNEAESEHLVELLRWVASDLEIGLLLIEHDVSVIMRLCAKIQVLDHGRTIALGSPEDVRRDPEVIRAYLGYEHAVD